MISLQDHKKCWLCYCRPCRWLSPTQTLIAHSDIFLFCLSLWPCWLVTIRMVPLMLHCSYQWVVPSHAQPDFVYLSSQIENAMPTIWRHWEPWLSVGDTSHSHAAIMIILAHCIYIYFFFLLLLLLIPFVEGCQAKVFIRCVSDLVFSKFWQWMWNCWQVL